MAATIVLGIVGAQPILARAEGRAMGRPDIVLILTDDQRWDTLGVMPTVSKRLAERGVRFENAFVTNPLCCPSRASILTGGYSHSTGVYRQISPYGRFESFNDTSTVATWLDNAGYETGFFGKYIDGGQRAYLDGYVPPGWSRWVAFVHAEYFGYRLSIDGDIRDHGVEPDDYSTDVLVDHAVGFLDRARAPAFLMLAVAAPHEPAIPAPRHADAPVRGRIIPLSFDEADLSDKPAWLRRLSRLGAEGRHAVASLRAQQIRSLQAVDDAVRALIERQRARGRLDDTVFIYTSDNGLSWGEHRWTKKEVPYEESIRVPLVIRFDGRAEPHVEDRMALNIDLAPTIADLAGLDVPDVDGRTLVPILENREVVWRTAFLVEHLMGANPVPTYCAVRTRSHLYVEYRTGERELYDLVADPYQVSNIAGDEPVLVRRMAERLAALCDPPPPLMPPPHAQPGSVSVDEAGMVIAMVVILAVAVGMSSARARRRPVGLTPPQLDPGPGDEPSDT